jgi:hypothetical protein
MARTPDLTKLQTWQKWLEQLANSKQSPRQFCDSIGCSMTTFYYWKRRCEQAALAAATGSAGAIIDPRRHFADRIEPSGASCAAQVQSSFLPVVVRAPSSSSVILVRSQCGLKITVPADAIGALEVVLQNLRRGA